MNAFLFALPFAVVKVVSTLLLILIIRFLYQKFTGKVVRSANGLELCGILFVGVSFVIYGYYLSSMAALELGLGLVMLALGVFLYRYIAGRGVAR